MKVLVEKLTNCKYGVVRTYKNSIAAIILLCCSQSIGPNVFLSELCFRVSTYFFLCIRSACTCYSDLSNKYAHVFAQIFALLTRKSKSWLRKIKLTKSNVRIKLFISNNTQL